MNRADEAFDYIVVGAGSSGCVVASRLSEDTTCRVLLLEAGGEDHHPFLRMPLAFLRAMVDPRFGWTYMSEPETHLNGRPLWLPRGRLLGGSSSINGMFYMRGHPLDYDGWRDAGCTGWGYADVLPYFKRMERSWRGANAYHGAEGPLAVRAIDTRWLPHAPLMQTAAAAGYSTSDDLSGERPEGFALGEVTIDARGRRASAASAYLWPARARRNLVIRTGAQVARVLFEDGRAVGVAYRHDGTDKAAAVRREVVLSGGTYNSPHLLMLSGIGPGRDLQAHGIEVRVDRPAVGGNLAEHPTVMMEFEANAPVTFLKELRIDRALRWTLQWALFGTGAFANQLNACNVVIRTLPELRQPDVQLMCNPIRFDARVWCPGVSKPQSHVFSIGVVDLHPKSRGRVSLASSDPQVLPKVALNIFAEPEDFATMRRGIRAARRIYRTPPQATLTGRETMPGEAVDDDTALDAYIRDTAIVCQHPVGTCRMGSDAEAVVDPQLRVRGVEALRVADAAIMPTVPGANTNASCIMIGEKAADLLRGR